MKRHDIVSSILAFLAAPCLLLVQHVAGPDSWLLFALALTSASVALFAWQLVAAYKWPLQTLPHAMRIRGSDLGLASAAGIAGFYAVWLVNPYIPIPPVVLIKILLCLYNWVLLSSLATSAHVSLVYSRRWGFLLWAPFAVQLGLLSWFTPDRCPLPAQPRWPSYWHLGSAGFSLAVSCLCCLCPAVRITLMLEPKEGYTNSVGGAYTYYERVPQACAVLSMLNITAVYMWETFGNEAFWQGFYHVVWSLLRPAYAALFTVFFLKGSDYLPSANKIACGLGFVYFAALATLSETTQTLHSPNMFEQRNGWSHTGAHGVEALCFNLSIVLFYVHGLSSGAWQDGDPRVCCCIPFVVLAAVLAVAIFLCAALGEFVHYSYEAENDIPIQYPAALSRIRPKVLQNLVIKYLFPYGTIAFVTSYITASCSKVPRHLVTFEVEESLNKKRVVQPESENRLLQPPVLPE